MAKIFDKFKKNNIQELDPAIADKILGNVFEEAGKQANTVPLEELTSYSKYRRERYGTQRGILVAILILFMLLPLLFIAPVFKVEEVVPTNSNRASQYEISVATPLPISSVTAQISGMNLPVYELSDHLYYVNPISNGELVIKVTLFNKQTMTQTITIGNIDTTTPICSSSEFDENYLYITVADDESGISYEEIRALTTSGETVYPANYDENTGTVVFDYPTENMNLYVPDNAGNVLQLVITIK